MAVITPGSGSTFSVIKLEEFFTGAIWLLQSLESDATRNPTALNNVTSSVNDDAQTMSASLTFRANVTSDTSGNSVVSCVDYLTLPSGASAHWIPGTGGTIKATTIQGAILESARIISDKENSASSNPLGSKNVIWSVSNGDQGSTNSVVSISVTGFPLVVTVTNGTATLKGKEYLN